MCKEQRGTPISGNTFGVDTMKLFRDWVKELDEDYNRVRYYNIEADMKGMVTAECSVEKLNYNCIPVCGLDDAIKFWDKNSGANIGLTDFKIEYNDKGDGAKNLCISCKGFFQREAENNK